MALVESKSGRILMGPLPAASDLVEALEGLVHQYKLVGGIFWISGVLSKLTTGTFDHRQQVYVTGTEEGLFELAACHGGMTLRQKAPFVWVHGVAFDDQGRSLGGRLLSPTILVSGRIYLQEIENPAAADGIFHQMDMAVCLAGRTDAARDP